jgi:acyl-CoA thioesterase I
MKKIIQIVFAFWIFVLIISCKTENSKPAISTTPTTVLSPNEINYLALGDSYTIGQSVCDLCRFPEQLKTKLGNEYPKNSFLEKVIARTGWTTTNLISAINQENLSPNYDLVTLLIGVNNQYQNKDFSIYTTEFVDLVNKAIILGKGSKSNLIVVSIPDYAFTPYGVSTGNQAKISTEIDNYNAFAQKYCQDNGITYVNITAITKEGLKNTKLVTTDDLHPSELAYAKFVELILPKAKIALEN